MNIFSSITDIGLRRVYKFVLQRVLGPFLDDDLLLDQVSLSSRDGRVELDDIALSCERLNGFLGNAPFRLRSCKLGHLAATMSYSNLLEDGISLTVSGVILEIEPVELVGFSASIATTSTKTHTRTNSKDQHKSSKESSNGSGIKQLETEGLEYLASWIEIIIAKLRVSIEDIALYVHSSRERSSAAALIVKLAKIMFYNSHPQEKAYQGGSLELSTRFQASNRSSFMSMGKHKYLTFEAIEVLIASKTDGSENLLLRTIGIGKISFSNSSSTTDVDIVLKEIKMNLCTSSISVLLAVISTFCAMGSSISSKAAPVNSMSERLLHFVEDCEIDFNKLEQLTRLYADAMVRIDDLPDEIITGSGHCSEDDDIDFPSSEDDDDDADNPSGFKTAVERELFQSVYGDKSIRSVMFKSALEGPGEKSLLSATANNALSLESFSVKVHIVSMTVEVIVNPDACILVLDVDNIICKNRRMASTGETILSMSAISLYEKNSRSDIIDFFVEEIEDDRRITNASPPHLELKICSNDTENSVEVKLVFEPVLLIVDPVLISQVANFVMLFHFGTSSQSPIVSYNFLIVAKKIEILLTNNESSFLSDIVQASQLHADEPACQQSKRWKLRLPGHVSRKIENTSGFRICFVNFSFDGTFPLDGIFRLNVINLAKIQVWLFTTSSFSQLSQRAPKFEAELLILDMRCWSDQNVQITFEDTVTTSPTKGSLFEESDLRAPGIDPPMEVLAKILKIECAQILVDLWDNEYSFCISLFTRISTTLFGKAAVPRADSVAAGETFKSPIGFQLQADGFIVKLSKLLEAINHETHSIVSYTLATQNMNLSLLSEGSKTNLRLATEDFAFYELFDALIEPSSDECPFLYRSSYNSNPTLLTKESFICSVLVSDEVGLILDELITNVTISLRFAGVLLDYNTQSAWAINIASILGGSSAPTLNQSNQTVRSKCQVFVNISDFMVVYSCFATGVKLMHNFENYSLTSNIASGSSKIGFKFLMKNLCCRVSKTLATDPIFKQHILTRKATKGKKAALVSLENFLLSHEFKDIYNIDTCETKLTHNYENGSMMIEMVLGFFSLTGCVDSYNALLDTLTYVWLEIKPPTVECGDEGMVSTEETDEAADLFVEEEAEHNKQLFAYPEKSSFKLVPSSDNTSSALDKHVLDDYCAGGDEVTAPRVSDSAGVFDREITPEGQARWLPDYGYSDDDDENDNDIYDTDVIQIDDEEASEAFSDDESSFAESSVLSDPRSGNGDKFNGYDSITLLNLEMDELLIWAPQESVSTEARKSMPDCVKTNEDIEVHSGSEAMAVNSSACTEASFEEIPKAKVFEHNIMHPIEQRQYNDEQILARSGYLYDGLDIDDQTARWYTTTEGIDRSGENIIPDGILREDHIGGAKESEQRKINTVSSPEIYISLKFSIRFQLYGGSDGLEPSFTKESKAAPSTRSSTGRPLFVDKTIKADAKEPRNKENRLDQDLLELSAKDLFFEFRLLRARHRRPVSEDLTTFELEMPHQFVSLRIQDLLLSFSKKSTKKKKVIGRWKGPHTDSAEPVMTLTMSTGYRRGSQSQELHILTLMIVPIRCYLDWYLLDFIKTAASVSQKLDEARNNVTNPTTHVEVSKKDKMVFFLFRIYSVHAKIDFKCGNFMIDKLRQGDFTQMLNIFPLEGLEISLEQIDLRRAVGLLDTLQKASEIWVNNIHERQIHRVISGVSPLRGLSRVGNGLQNLICIPVNEYQKHGFDDNFLRIIRQSASNFIHTVATEALHASHQLTMFVANTIQDIVADESSSGAVSPTTKRAQQPEGIKDSLSLAYGALQREIGTVAETIVAVPIKQYEKAGAGGYMKSVIRAMPIAILRPAAGVSEAISYTLLGLRNQLDPRTKLDEEDEWNADHSLFLGLGGAAKKSQHNRDKMYESYLNKPQSGSGGGGKR